MCVERGLKDCRWWWMMLLGEEGAVGKEMGEGMGGCDGMEWNGQEKEQMASLRRELSHAATTTCEAGLLGALDKIRGCRGSREWGGRECWARHKNVEWGGWHRAAGMGNQSVKLRASRVRVLNDSSGSYGHRWAK